MTDVTELHEFIIKRLENLDDLSPPGSFEENMPPHGKVEVTEVGPWLWIKARYIYEGTTHDRTSGVSGDPYQGHLSFDWVGPLETAPKKASSFDDLEEWAHVKTKYTREYTDVGMWGEQSGSWVDDLQEDGTVMVRKSKGAFRDVTPESMTEVEEIKLEK